MGERVRLGAVVVDSDQDGLLAGITAPWGSLESVLVDISLAEFITW